MKKPRLLHDTLVRPYLIKAFYLYIVLSAASILLFADRWFILAGLTLGGGLSYARLTATDGMVSFLLRQDKIQGFLQNKILKYVMVQIVTVLFLTGSALQGIGFFLGTVVGVLLLPAAISLASIFGAFGITQSRFRKEGARDGFTGEAHRGGHPQKPV